MFYIGLEALELEDGLGNLLLENSDTLIGEGEGLIQVVDDNPVLAILYYWLHPSFSLQLFDTIHFGPDGVDTFQEPSTFNIIEGPADFELRTPE